MNHNIKEFLVWFGFFQVFQGCGNPKISTKASSGEDKKKRGKAVTDDKSSGFGVEKLVSVSLNFRDIFIKHFALGILYALCSCHVSRSSLTQQQDVTETCAHQPHLGLVVCSV